MGKILASILLWPFKAVAFLALIFYEWGWEPLAKWIARLARFRVIAAIERKMRRAPPWAALLLFLVPTLLLLPVKLGAVWLIAHGKKLIGIGLIIAAKLVGTAIVAWMFKLTQPALMQLRWFAWVYTRVHAWKTRWINALKATRAWAAFLRLRVGLRAVLLKLRSTFLFWKN
jgi:hypothetical protein